VFLVFLAAKGLGRRTPSYSQISRGITLGESGRGEFPPGVHVNLYSRFLNRAFEPATEFLCLIGENPPAAGLSGLREPQAPQRPRRNCFFRSAQVTESTKVQHLLPFFAPRIMPTPEVGILPQF